MMQLQSIVNASVHLDERETNEPKDEVYVDLSKLDFQKLKAAFAKAPRKNSLVFDLQQAIDQKLQQMLKENPMRLDFYERYKEIVDEYNRGKSLEDTVATFDKLSHYVADLTFEEQRVIRENLKDQETLAIFDLLSDGKELFGKDLKQVKKVASETLEKLKSEKLKIDHWREKREVTAQVKSEIYNQFLAPQIY
jgi:type I restriction enzyme R subunit